MATTAQAAEPGAGGPGAGPAAAEGAEQAAAAAAPAATERRVAAGDHVVLDINNGDKKVLAVATQGYRLKLGRDYVSVQPMLGQAYGELYRLTADRRALEKVDRKRDFEWESVLDEERNNSKIVDNGQAQTLTPQQIEELKREGLEGEEVIQKLMAASKTFETKTQFSQDKYKRKKQKKYMTEVTVCIPSLRSICEAYHKRDPYKHLRVDTLSMLLNCANVGPHARVLVFESAGGVASGAAIERLGGYGRVCTVGARGTGNLDAVRWFNFEERVLGAACQAHVNQLRAAALGGKGDGAAAEAPPAGERKGPRPVKNKRLPRQATPEALAELAREGFTSVLVAASRFDPAEVLEALLPAVAPSASLAVFCEYLQPLADCMHKLQTERRALGLNIIEAVWREHQVLPSRTHPHMSMAHGGSGGYILSGTVCEPEPAAPPAAAAGAAVEAAAGRPEGGTPGEGTGGAPQGAASAAMEFL